MGTLHPTAANWFAAARENCNDAQALAKSHGWRNAYIIAGTAVECALKGQIMQQLGLNQWPTIQERREFYTHDLTTLAGLAKLQGALEAAVLQGDVVGGTWMVAKDFSMNRRYPLNQPFPIKLGRDMVYAVARDGLVEWLIAQKKV